MARTVIRTWTRRGAIVSTVHPQLGEFTRGRIEPVDSPDATARGTWCLTDQDHRAHGVVVGDYLDAEARLLEITGWADQLDTDPLTFTMQPADQPLTAAPQAGQAEPGKTLLARDLLGDADRWQPRRERLDAY